MAGSRPGNAGDQISGSARAVHQLEEAPCGAGGVVGEVGAHPDLLRADPDSPVAKALGIVHSLDPRPVHRGRGIS